MKRHSIFTAGLLLVTLLTLSTELTAQKKRPPRKEIRESVTVTAPPPLSPEKQRRSDAFEKTWSTLQENYFDQTFSGLNWGKVYLEFEPKVAAAKTDAEVHRLITEMIGRIGRSHFAVIPPEYFNTLKAAKAAAKERERLLAAEGGKAAPPVEAVESDEELLDDNPDATYGIGVELRLINKQFVVTHVEPGSAAQTVGIKPGFVIDKINGVSLQDLVRRITTEYATVKNLERYLPSQIVGWFLNGERDTVVFLTCLDALDKPVDFKVGRLALSGEKVTLGDRFPDQLMNFETASLNSDVGYIRFNVFSLAVIAKFCDALTKFKDRAAIIIDLRGNVGGVLGTLVALTGMMTERQLALGTSIYKVGREPMIADSKAKNFKGKVVFLVDNQTVSAAEIFSAGMQENRRALVVGQRTGGEALPAVSTPLATGAVLVYPIANFLTNKGRSLEGNGVEPDFAVAMDRASLLKGVDPHIEKALSLIRENSAFPAAQAVAMGSGTAAAVPPPPAPLLTKLRPPPPVAKVPEKPVPAVPKDKKSLDLIEDYTRRIGGREPFKKLATYLAVGSSVIELRGSETKTTLHAVREFPLRYALILTVGAVGDVREVYNGTNSFLQTEYGLERDLSKDANVPGSDLFSAVLTTIDPDNFKTLIYKTVIDVEGRPTHVIEAAMLRGEPAALAFDVETGMLSTFVVGGIMHNLSDYRKVGDVSLPFSIDLNRAMKVRLDSITLNQPIDPTYFAKKQFCFDKAQ